MSRILVVEDEQSFSDALSFMLRKEGFDVAVADDGQVAVETFERDGADLVLLDIMLPGMSGTEVCQCSLVVTRPRSSMTTPALARPSPCV